MADAVRDLLNLGFPNIEGLDTKNSETPDYVLLPFRLLLENQGP